MAERARHVIGLCLQTGWPPSEIRGMSLRELAVLTEGITDRARQRRMAASAAKHRKR